MNEDVIKPIPLSLCKTDTDVHIKMPFPRTYMSYCRMVIHQFMLIGYFCLLIKIGTLTL